MKFPIEFTELWLIQMCSLLLLFCFLWFWPTKLSPNKKNKKPAGHIKRETGIAIIGSIKKAAQNQTVIIKKIQKILLLNIVSKNDFFTSTELIFTCPIRFYCLKCLKLKSSKGLLFSLFNLSITTICA